MLAEFLADRGNWVQVMPGARACLFSLEESPFPLHLPLHLDHLHFETLFCQSGTMALTRRDGSALRLGARQVLLFTDLSGLAGARVDTPLEGILVAVDARGARGSLDTIVFDKTGTLTHACPRVARVIPFNGMEEAEMLRLAACLEEHFPHSMANAVVEEARRRSLNHEERHAKVEYLVAHGIASSVDGEQVRIGSAHFIFEDEKVTIPEGEQEKFDALPPEFSQLYLAIDGVLSAVLYISDPVREEAKDVLSALRGLGVKNAVMLTGDSPRTATAIAKELGVDDFRAGVLPADKADYVSALRREGHTVLMVGDGINDSPALSEADAGIAISDGAAIAREIADITIAADSLWELVRLRQLAMALMNRIQNNYRFVIGFNGALIGLGIVGILPPATSAMLHNLSTLGVSLHSMSALPVAGQATKVLKDL